MGYELYIKREPPLTLEEWKAAVKKTNGVRLDSSGYSVTNPKSGELISVGGMDGDVQAKINGEWLPSFRWREGSVVFRAPSDFNDSASEMRRIASELIRHLGAQIIGDDGEEYT